MRTSLILSVLLLIGLVGCANRTKTHVTRIENTPAHVEDIQTTVEILPTFISFFDLETNQETISFSFYKPTSWWVQLQDWEQKDRGFYTVAYGTILDGEVPYGLWMKKGHDYDVRIVTGDGKVIYQIKTGKDKPVTILLP